MKIFTHIVSVAACALIASSAAVAVAAPLGVGFDAATYVHKNMVVRSGLDKGRSATIDHINVLLNKDDAAASPMFNAAARSYSVPDPTVTFGPVSTFGDIDGPDGEVWFYTMNIENTAIKHEYFTEYRLKSYTVNIYDSQFKEIGSIHDEMDYAADEIRVPACVLLPSVTKNFFNDDAKYELVIGLAVNTTTPGITRYRSLAYQLDGEKDSDGSDKIIATFPELICNVLDATTEGGPENIYMSTMTEYFPTDFPENGDMWQYRMESFVRVQIYGKAGQDGQPIEILSYDMCHLNLPGNQETSPFLLTLSDGGKPYAVLSHYKETLFEPYNSSDEDMVQRKENALIIDVYELGSTAVRSQQTVIPFTKDSEDDVIGSFYSIGDLRYSQDVNFHDFDNSGKAAFYVTKGNKVVGSDEVLESSYYVYMHDGTRKSTIFEHSQSTLPLSDIAGCEPQNMFVSLGNNQYVFNFVDILSGKVVSSVNQYLEIDNSDPDPLLSTMDRVADGSSYKYAVEMRYPIEEDDIAYMRIAWLNADGTPDHIDEVNMGKGVNYAKSFLESKTLDPTTFHSDKHQEYILLIKRGVNGGTSEELLIGQTRTEEYPDGRDILYLPPGEKGFLVSVVPYSAAGLPTLAVAYSPDNATFNVDYYTLPLDAPHSGIGETISDVVSEADIVFDGNTAYAEGFTIELYSIHGMLIASATDRLDISTFPAGAYIVKAGNTAKKIIK